MMKEIDQFQLNNDKKNQQHYQSLKMEKLLMFILLIGIGRCIEPTPEQILSSNYEGKWTKANGFQIPSSSPFQIFNEKEGEAIVDFSDLGHNSEKIQGLIVTFLNPKYYDQKVMKFIIPLADYSQRTKTWQGKAQVSFQFFDNTYTAQRGQQLVQYWVDKSNLAITFTIEKNMVSIWVSFSLTHISPIVPIIFTIFALLVFLGTERPRNMLQTYYRHQIIPIILSITFVCMVSIVELIIGFNSLFGIMNPEAFFVFAALINLATCVQAVKFYGPIILRRNILIILVWITTIAYVLGLLFFRHSYIFFLVNSFILIPEIAYHIVRGRKFKGDLKMILFVLSNQFYVLYFKSCPQNIFRQSPNYLLGYCIIGIFFIQLAFIRAQVSYGPRFFIPSIFLPEKYNYYDKKKILSLPKLQNIVPQCYICLTQIRIQEYNKRKLMVTPCKHVFHADCLEGWMIVRMSCPVDRSQLPPI